MEKYFNKFPTIIYNGSACVDLTRRVAIDPLYKNNVTLFNPLELRSGLRPDIIADAYYEDAEMDWMIYLANDIIDPYFGWYLDELEFNDFINVKYGSLEAAVEKIKYYRNNWANSEAEITPAVYNNHLVWDEKQYWTPNYGNGAQIISYKRKAEDWTMNTNKIIQYDIAANTYVTDEIVDFKVSGEVVGGGTVVTANDTQLIIQHVSGNVVANSTWTKTIIGETSGTEANTNAYEVLHENITNATAKYWSTVSYYDFEVEQNESKKILSIVDKSVAFDLAELMRTKLKDD
jgi:hypothetical protein